MGWLQLLAFGILVAPHLSDYASFPNSEDAEHNLIKYTLEFKCPERQFVFTCVMKVDEALLSDIKTGTGQSSLKLILKSYRLDPEEWGETIVGAYVDIIHNCGPNEALQRKRLNLEPCHLEDSCSFAMLVRLDED